jgi:hypothetical protein
VSAQLIDEHHGVKDAIGENNGTISSVISLMMRSSDVNWGYLTPGGSLSQLVHSASKDLRRFVGLRHLTALLP